jgi:trigger factor
MAEVETVVLENNVTDFVLSKAKVSEKAITFDELMAQN